jgi:hypothetical protein
MAIIVKIMAIIYEIIAIIFFKAFAFQVQQYKNGRKKQG